MLPAKEERSREGRGRGTDAHLPLPASPREVLGAGGMGRGPRTGLSNSQQAPEAKNSQSPLLQIINRSVILAERDPLVFKLPVTFGVCLGNSATNW